MQSWNHFLLQHLKQYGKEKTVTDDWDKLQRDLRWKCFWSQTFVSFARASKLIYKKRSESLLSLAVCYMYVICIEPSAATHFFRKMAQWLKWSGSAQGSTRIIYTVWFNPHWNLAIHCACITSGDSPITTHLLSMIQRIQASLEHRMPDQSRMYSTKYWQGLR